MRLNDFLKYPNIGSHLTMMRPFEWTDSGLPPVHQTEAQQLWFLFGAFNLVYQNVGMVIYMCLAKPAEKDLGAYIEHISETFSVMSLTVVGASNMWMMLQYRKDIESLLAELEELFPKRGKDTRHYRTQYYYTKSTRLMKYISIYFLSAYVFYNCLPIVELVYELSLESQHFKYKYQSNTWYPWQLLAAPHSIISFVAAYLCQALSSLVGVAFIMAGLFWQSFFITQMQLHFDALAETLLLLDARQPGANDQLKQLISYHSRLLLISNEINRIFNLSFFMNFTTSTVAICMIAFSMVMISLVSTFKYCVGFLGFLIFTLFICYNGSNFTSSHDKLMPAAFYNNWYEGDLTYRKMILFFIMQSSQSRVLRAYKFTPVSMETYMAILKLSYQLFTFFRAMI